MPRNPMLNPAIRFHHLPDGVPHTHAPVAYREHPGHRVIAVCGKGGVGKTAFTALLGRSIVEHGDLGSLLMIDADPALGLALALGIEPSNTLASVRDELLSAAENGSPTEEQRMADNLDYLVYETLSDQGDFGFLALGRSRDLGCYCSINDLLRDAIELLCDEFDVVLIDGEAGLEQINRQVISNIDDLVIVSDGSNRSARTVETLWDMAHENNIIDDRHIHLVWNRQKNRANTAPLRNDVRPHVLGSISDSENLSQLDRDCLPLWSLDGGTQAQADVAAICAHLMTH